MSWPYLPPELFDGKRQPLSESDAWLLLSLGIVTIILLWLTLPGINQKEK